MLADCPDEEELELLSVDLLTLGELTESILVHKKHCNTARGCRSLDE